MAKYKFEPNIWIKFEYKGVPAIGRTLYGTDKAETVSFVSQTGYIGVIMFREIEAPKRLKIFNLQENNFNISRSLPN